MQRIPTPKPAHGSSAHFAEALRLAPENAGDGPSWHAETFYSVPKPDWAAALAAWQTVQRLNPQPDFALLNQARIHLKMNDLTQQKDA